MFIDSQFKSPPPLVTLTCWRRSLSFLKSLLQFTKLHRTPLSPSHPTRPEPPGRDWVAAPPILEDWGTVSSNLPPVLGDILTASWDFRGFLGGSLGLEVTGGSGWSTGLDSDTGSILDLAPGSVLGSAPGSGLDRGGAGLTWERMIPGFWEDFFNSFQILRIFFKGGSSKKSKSSTFSWRLFDSKWRHSSWTIMGVI